MSSPSTVVISGASGLLGRALTAALLADGIEVAHLVRRATPTPTEGRVHQVTWDPGSATIDLEGLNALGPISAVVNLSGAGIADRRWTDARRAEIRSSRLATTALLASTITELAIAPQVFLSGSAIGIYGDRGDVVLDEASEPGSGFLAQLCEDWEAAASPATAATRVVTLRTGIVLSGDGGALVKQLTIFKLGLGGKLGTGQQWVSWIDVADWVAAVRWCMTSSALSGAVNLVGPSPVRNVTLTKAIASAVHRPHLATAPRVALELALGRPVANEVLLASQRVVPKVLEASGFSFAVTSVEESIARSLKQR